MTIPPMTQDLFELVQGILYREGLTAQNCTVRATEAGLSVTFPLELPAPMRSLLEQFLAVPEVARVLADSALDMQDAEARADRRASEGHPLATAELDRAIAELRDFLEEAEQ